VVLAVPHSGAQPLGKALLAAIGGWALFRLATRSQSALATATDYLLTLANCLAVPVLVAGNDFYRVNCAPIAIAGTAVIGLGVSLPIRASLPMTAGIAAASAYGAAGVVGWAHVGDMFNLYYFGLQWATAALIRWMLSRVAAAVDDARHQRGAAEVSGQVTTAVRDYDRDQLWLLHDTVASTLLITGEDTPLPPDRLAAQARRDLVLLDQQPAALDHPAALDLAAELREVALHLRTAQHWTGCQELWVDGRIGHQVVAAAREAMNNVDRHSAAGRVTINVATHRVTIGDDGVGFDSATQSGGTGIAQSIAARMQRIGGSALVLSRLGHGTVGALYWAPDTFADDAGEHVGDPDRLIERARLGYAAALTAYAVINVVASALPALGLPGQRGAQMTLTAIAIGATLGAGPGSIGRPALPSWWPARVLLVVAIVQTMLIPVGALGSQAHWTQAAMGLCLLPHLLRGRVRRGAAMLVALWLLPALSEVARAPSSFTILNVGLGTASILGVQLFALFFNELIRTGAEEASAQTVLQVEALARERIAEALRVDHRRRYSQVVTTVRPLLKALAEGQPVDDAARRFARGESQRLRTLFEQAESFDHPLLRELRAAVETASDTGLEVSLHVFGQLPRIATHDVARICAPLKQVLTSAPTSARVTVTATAAGLTASVACKGLPADALAGYLPKDHLEVTTVGDSLWLSVQHNVPTR
jgi:hypothetical protein